jgi:hypothetical protein
MQCQEQTIRYVEGTVQHWSLKAGTETARSEIVQCVCGTRQCGGVHLLLHFPDTRVT